MGFLPGIVTPGGVTHQAIEDIAIMRATPNMTVLETGDATEVESVLDVAQAIDGPVYVRFLRGEMPRLFPKSEPMVLNRARVIRRGGDVALLTSGIITEEALRAGAALEAKGVSVSHLHISTLKPFTDPTVLDAIRAAKHGVITMENHLVTGGLGSAVAEMMAEHGVGKPLVRLGLQDTYSHGASKGYLMAEHELDAMALVRNVEKMMKVRLNIAQEDLDQHRIEAVHSDAKAEAL